MAVESLECTLTWRKTGLRSPTYLVADDPGDAARMQELLIKLARGWRNLDATLGWVDQYEMEVRRKDRPWEDPIHVPGIKP